MKQIIMQFKVCIGMLLGATIGVTSVLHAAANPVFLITATKKAPAVVYDGEVVTATYTIKNNPINPNTLYGNGVSALPRGVKVVGGSCSRPVFNLTRGQSCTLQLQIIADQLQGDVNGGPNVCNSLQHPIHCSAPPKTQALQVIKKKTPPPVRTTTLSIDPATLFLLPDGDSKVITITNKGSVPAYNVQVKKAPELGIRITGKCNSPLAPNKTCQLTVTSGSQEGSTEALIAGENTKDAPLRVTSAPLTTLSVTAITSPAIIGVNTPGGGVSLSIENTGTTTAYNVTYTLPDKWLGVQAGDCGNIEPGMANACTLTFTATQPNLADVVQISADNTSTKEPSPYIAFRFKGGLVFSIQGTRPHATAKVVTETEQGTNVRWGNNGTTYANDLTHGQNLNAVPGSTNPNNTGTNGPGNTYQILSILPPAAATAAQLCTSYDDGDGITDWYLPAVCDWSNLPTPLYNSCTTENINDNLRVLGFGNFTGGYYWTSNEALSSSNEFAIALYTTTSTNNPIPKSAAINTNVRCVRDINNI